jgi:hypothetical protein
VGTGIDDKGQPISYYDGEPAEPVGVEQRLRLAAANTLQIAVGAACSSWTLPVFLARDRSLSPTTQRLTVRLEARCLGDLPDVQAYIAYGEFMDRALAGSVLAGGGDTDQLRRHAATIAVCAGQLLPVAVQGRAGDVLGVLDLERELDPGVFLASLFASDSKVVAQRGTRLARTTRWDDGGTTRTLTAPIGTVLEFRP